MAGGGGQKPGVSGRDQQMAALLASGRTHAQVAETLNLGVRTVERAAPRLRALVEELRAEVVGRAVAELADAMSSAVRTLKELAEGGRQDAVRVSAARALLEFSLRGREQIELAAKLREIEDKLRASDGNPSQT